MRSSLFGRFALQVASTIVAVSISVVATAATLDETVTSGTNFEKAEFRLWYPDNAGTLRAIVVLMPGSNDDGRWMAGDSFWQAFAIRHEVAIVSCYFTDKPHSQMFIEHYVQASRGSGQALLNTLAAFAKRSKHPELAGAPLLLWGVSAGGEFNYEFVVWRPERVVAFVVNKGGIYYTALVPEAARRVPGILFTGEKDLEFRTKTIAGLFALNRRAGALWALADEPGVGHEVGRSRDMTEIFFEDLLALRLGARSPDPKESSTLRPVAEGDGLLGDLKTGIFNVARDSIAPDYPTAWLPTRRIARAWQALVTGKPFDY